MALFSREAYGYSAVALLLVLSVQQTYAQTTRAWTNTTNTNNFYDIGTNWSPAGAPGVSDTALFNQSASYDVRWDSLVGDRELRAMNVSDGNVTFRNASMDPQHELRIASDLVINGSLLNHGLHIRVAAPFLEVGEMRVDGGLTIDGSHASGSQLTIFGVTRLQGRIGVVSGGIANLGDFLSGPTSTLRVAGTGSRLMTNLYNSQGSEMDILAGGVVDSNRGVLDGVAGATSARVGVSGVGSQWNLATILQLGAHSTQLEIDGGGSVTSDSAIVAQGLTGVAEVSVEGTSSQWLVTNELVVGQGSGANASIQVGNGGLLSAGRASIGSTDVPDFGPASGNVTVEGAGSRWNVANEVIVGDNGAGVVLVVDGGEFYSRSATVGGIGDSILTSGQVIVTGAGAHWVVENELTVGLSNTGDVLVGNEGLVSVGGQTGIGGRGTVIMSGGRFEFGQTTLRAFSRIGGTSGSLAGNLNNKGYTDVSTLSPLIGSSLNMEDVTLSNVGTLFGNASLGTALINDGQVETIAGERMRFAGANNVNRGEIRNFDGQIRFDQSLANESFVAGRGQFIAGDWMNAGVMAFSGGNTDVVGDLINEPGGQIVTTGVGVTTFFDDVVHNGHEIRTSAGSSTVFLGEVSGSGPFTGTGTVYFEGDLRPGNSPAIVEFEGDLVLGTLADTFIEIGGLNLGEFDQFQVAGDMNLGGNLHVSLIDSFTLGFNQEFLIADVGGALSGTFAELREGDLVGTFGSQDLFIGYSHGSNSGVYLFTAVPEPSLAGFCSLTVLLVYRRRRRQRSMRAVRSA